MEYNIELHDKLVQIGRTIEKGVSHGLEPEIIQGIIATIEYFGPTESQASTLRYDLCVAKYKIFDWLGMWYAGRCEDRDDPHTSKSIHGIIEKLIRHYIAMGNVGGWAWSLRGHLDLDVADDEIIDGKCQDCIESYQEWHTKTPEQRRNEQEEIEAAFDGNVIHL